MNNTFGTSNGVLYGNGSVPGVKSYVEAWMTTTFTSAKWKEVTSSNGGQDIPLAQNQWLVAYRMGKNSTRMDYHFWYRTNTGEWVNKHGFRTGSGSEKLGSDLPTSISSIGWNLDTITSFYNSDIIYYVITM